VSPYAKCLMRPFPCPTCQTQVFFENTLCTACGSTIGYEAEENRFVCVDADHDSLSFCANHIHSGCNWTVRDAGRYCLSCDLNEMIPPVDDPEQRRRWADVEVSKRRFLYSVMRMDIPIYPKRHDPTGLSFRILVDAEHGGAGNVTMGHQNGVITIDATEADAHLREFRRAELDERYRTLLGHMRHESGHYFWERLLLIEGFDTEFRALFGDEREDYGEALKRYYKQGAPADWQEKHISAYCTAHPWEDWAETFAHYMHIVDGVETVEAYRQAKDEDPFDPYKRDVFALTLQRWMSTALLMNAMNRSLGHQDYYPFVVNESVADKMRFIDQWMGKLRAN
jgi:hypothetical protein